MDIRSKMKKHDLLSPLLPSEQLTFVHAQGAEYIDEQGRTYVDLNEMCQVLGQGNEAYIHAMTEALSGVTTGKVGFSPAKAKLYAHFMEATRGDFKGIHLTTSGSEAVEWAYRLAKRMTGRTEIVSFWNSIHGRTYLSASMSGLPRRKTGYGPLAPGVVLVPYPRCHGCPHREICGQENYPCLEYAKQQYRYGSAQDAAAVIVEPYQGACIDIAPKGYMETLYRWAKEQGMLFIMDEMQAGMGRSGDMFNYQRYDFVPDMLLVGKGLGNGMHISALLTRQLPDAESLPAVSGGVGDETLSCASACQVFEQLGDGLQEHIRRMSDVMRAGLEPLKACEAVMDVRSIGLAAAIEFRRSEDCSRVHAMLREKGFFTGHVANCITCKPPYVITGEQIEKFTGAIRNCIRKL